MTAGAPESRVFTDQDMAEEQVLSVGPGRVGLFSARSPERQGGNQDGALVASLGADRCLLAVADGLGGQPGGASAADLALTCLKEAVGQAAPDAPLRSLVLDAIDRANREVLELGIGAATTLAVAEIDGEGMRPYHVGDSAILAVGQRGRMKLQTLSHSPVGYAVEAGMLDEHEAMHHDERHLISNMVGSPDMRIEVGSVLRLAPRDTVLLATDGLLDNLSITEIVERMRAGALGRAARRLAATCQERMLQPREGQPSKPDDLTFILFRRS